MTVQDRLRFEKNMYSTVVDILVHLLLVLYSLK